MPDLRPIVVSTSAWRSGAEVRSDDRKRRQAGLTLIEIVIVIAVMGMMVGMTVIGLGAGRQGEVSRITHQIGNTIRYGYDKARVNGEYYRLHIDLDKGTFALQAGEGAMYLPATDRDGKVVAIDQRKLEAQADRDARAADSFNRSVQSQAFTDDQAAEGADDLYKARPRQVPRQRPPLFEAFDDDNSLSKLAKPFSLPEGMKIVYFRTADDFTPITEGQASLYFFPRGRTQKAYIQLVDDKSDARYTIKVEPLTGRISIAEGQEDLVLPKDASDEVDDLGERMERRTL